MSAIALGHDESDTGECIVSRVVGRARLCALAQICAPSSRAGSGKGQAMPCLQHELQDAIGALIRLHSSARSVRRVRGSAGWAADVCPVYLLVPFVLFPSCVLLCLVAASSARLFVFGQAFRRTCGVAWVSRASSTRLVPSRPRIAIARTRVSWCANRDRRPLGPRGSKLPAAWLPFAADPRPRNAPGASAPPTGRAAAMGKKGPAELALSLLVVYPRLKCRSSTFDGRAP